MSARAHTQRDVHVHAVVAILVGATACTVSACEASTPRDTGVGSALAASSANAGINARGVATLSATNSELESLARGLTNEALQVTRAKELADFSMEPDTHAAALRAQTEEVTTAIAAELVGLPAARYRELRSAVVMSISGTAMPAAAGALPAEVEDRARAMGVDAAWAAYVAALATGGSHPR